MPLPKPDYDSNADAERVDRLMRECPEEADWTVGDVSSLLTAVEDRWYGSRVAEAIAVLLRSGRAEETNNERSVMMTFRPTSSR